jgi:hypothetical protein
MSVQNKVFNSISTLTSISRISIGKTNLNRWGILVAAILFMANVYSLFNVTIDDGYIVLRYAHNFVQHGKLEFNLGESVSALTSPLHALWCAFLDLSTGKPEFANKICSAIIVLICMLWSISSTIRPAADRNLVLIIVLGCPFLAFWTVAGLETGLLAATLAVLTALYLKAADYPKEPHQLFAISLLAAIAFLFRYDSIMFTAPVLGHLIFQRGRSGLLYLLPAILLLSSFLFMWYSFYGTILPTSYYLKHPSVEGSQLRQGLNYEASYFVFCLGILWIGRRLSWSYAYKTAGRKLTGASLGLLLISVYALSAGTVHMMFGYRMLIPYLPVFAIWFTKLTIENNTKIGIRLLVAILISPAILYIIWNVSINPSIYDFIWSRPRGLNAPLEYARLPLPRYLDFIDQLYLSSSDISEDWRRRGVKGTPVLATIAGGITPYVLKDAYIYEQLVSFRLNCKATGLLETISSYAPASNYTQLLPLPELGSVEDYIGKLESKVQLVSRRPFKFTIFGRQPIDTEIIVFWNPEPHPLHLPSLLNGECPA